MAKNQPWKSSFRSLPERITTKLRMLRSPLVIVAATKRIPVTEIGAGAYRHLGLDHDGTTITTTASVTPSASVGTYSARNRNGWEVKRTDLPMIKKTFFWETPNFGDAATYGTHMNSQERDVYQKQIFEARGYSISTELLNSPGVGTALIKFAVNTVIDVNVNNFDDELLFCVNFLQENTGVADVFASNATRDDFIGTLQLDWEIFPPGNTAELIESLSRGGATLSPLKRGIVESRLALFAKMPVEKLIRGTNSFGSYIGALYADDLVVFENMNYGNALYVLYDNWQEVSRRSRVDLLRGTNDRYDRFVHTEGWEDRFKAHIEDELAKRGRRTRRRRR